MPCLFTAPSGFMPDIREAYEQLLPTRFKEVWDKKELEADEEVTAWVVNPGQRFVVDERVLELFPKLEVIVTPSTGSNHIDKAACERSNVAAYSLLDDREGLERIAASAEFTFLLLLNTLRRLDVAVREVAEGRWRHREEALRGHELSGKKVGLVGLGRIGRRLARYGRAFEATVSYHDPYVHDETLPSVSLPELFAANDIICICCALNEETRGMIDGAVLETLPPGARLVNTSRGEVINEQDLAQLLSARPDVRVSVDVLAGEVTGTHGNSPLLAFIEKGQIVVTPHVAGATVESQTKAARIALELLRRHMTSQAGLASQSPHIER